MTTNRSDYNKPRFNINSFLPGQLKNELSTSLFDNLHNRFLTKNDTVYQRGSIGRPSANNTERFDEASTFRRAYQIQPHIKIESDSQTKLFNWTDAVNRCRQLGIDFDSYGEWGKVKQFNFAPPINPDKLINYRDYYWVDPNTAPEYITIQNIATALRAQQKLIQQQLDLELKQTPIDAAKVDELQYHLLLTIAKIRAAGNESIGWDVGYFDDNGGVQATVSGPTYTVDFGIALTEGVSFWINDALVEPVSVVGSQVTFSVLVFPTDTILVNVPWFYAVNPGSTPPIGEFAWFNTNDGQLYRYDSTTVDWIIVDPQPTNDIGFDQFNTKTASERQWTDSNHWVHRQFVDNFSNTIQAQLPIIEYIQGTKLNEYLNVKFHWKYRATPNLPFQSVESEPSVIELSTRYPLINDQSPVNDQIIKVGGDRTSVLYHGVVFSVENVNYPYQAVQLTVQEALFVDGVTTIYTTTPIDITVPFPSAVVPTSKTSLGDTYRGVHVHWMLDYVDRPIPGDVSTIYSPSSKQHTWIVGQGTDTSISAKFETSNLRWYVASGNIPLHFVNGDVFYVDGNDRPLALRIVEPNSFELHYVGTNDSFVGTNQEYVTFLATKYILPTSLGFLGGSGNLRLYINQVRQSDNYYEATTDLDGNTTAVGFQQPGDTIVFNTDFPSIGDTIYIESHVVSSTDIGREFVHVRRSEADIYQLEQRSLVRYFKYEQLKYEPNQYPLFDLFDHRGNHSGRTSPIWSFDESPEFPSNPIIGGRRIRVSNQRKVYHFVNDLVDTDSGSIFAYKRKNGITNLKTIWESSGEYVPQLVNDQRQHNGDVVNVDGVDTTIVVDSTNGVWELPDPMFYNPTHKLRSKYSTTELFAHYNSIIRQQPTEAVATLVDFDYTVGGTIKEHNFAFDDWLSSLLASPVSTIDIINFAKHQYTETILNIRNLVIDQYCQFAVDTVTNDAQKQVAIQQTVDRMFATDQLRGRVFGDSDSFDQTYGVPNTIATAARLGLWPTYRPYLIQEPTEPTYRISTHIGSKIDCTLNASEYNTLVQRISESNNTIKSRNLPQVGQLLPGQYWLNLTNRTLHQYTVDFQQTNAPIVNRIGQTWVNTGDYQLYRWDGASWVGYGQVTTLAGLLIDLNISDLLSSILLNFENKLFQVAAANQPAQKYDYTQLTTTDSRQQLYARYLSDSFYQYCKERSIDPYTNSTFQLTDPFTWNYSKVQNVNVVYPNAEYVGRWAGATAGIYQLIFSTDVPHLEPWKLQGYVSKPSWWNQHYQDSLNRRWKYNHATGVGMWANVMQGIVPAGVRYPSGVMSSGDPVADGQQLPTYQFVPVNITNDTIAGYAPDSLLPVYVSDPILAQFALIRNQQFVDLTSVGDPWTVGDYGPVENNWRQSTEFVYDQLVIAYKMDPIRFFFQSSGKPTTVIGELIVDTVTGKVHNHYDTNFHGQFPPNYQQQVSYLGINQWYSNYFRFHDVDLTTSNVYHDWTSWDIVGGYATDYMIDAKSVDVYLSCGKMNASDYSVVIKQSHGVDTFNIDNLIVSTVDVGTYNITYNAKSPRGYGDDWTYRIGTSAPVAKQFQYYGVKRYQANYVGSSNFSIIIDHKLKTGDLVRLYSSGTLPVPLNSFDDYYIIVNGNEFMLARNQANARSGLAIDILSGTDQPFSIGAVRSTFVPLGGQHSLLTWTTYEPDRDQILTTELPLNVTGIQSIVDFVIGYGARLQDLGSVLTNEFSSNNDPITGRQWTWDLELERLIDQIYIGLGTSVNVLKRDQPVLTTEFVELNPFRVQCNVSPTAGIVGNVFDRGPSYLIGDPMVYDQYGRLFTQDQLFVFRQDRLTTIKLDTRAVPQTDPLNSIHIGGMQLAIDTFEHVIAFKPNSVVYNAHLGVEIQSLYLAMRRASERTGRPNVGGYFLYNDHLQENIDTSAANVSNFYNPYAADDFSGYIDYAHSLIGYIPPDYLDSLRVTDKSKFNFWRGMIQSKGAKSVVNALGNASQLSGIDVDEFWAYRKATFGSNKTIKATLDFRVGINDINNNRLLTYFPVGQAIELPAPYIAITPALDGRYINAIAHQSTLDTIQNYYVEPELTDVTASIVRKDNQRQPDGSTINAHYLFTDVPYDAFVIHVDREPEVLGFFEDNVHVPRSDYYTLVTIPLSKNIQVGRNDVVVKINDRTAIVQRDYLESPTSIFVGVRSVNSGEWVRIKIEVIQGSRQLVPNLDYEVLGPTACKISYDITGLTCRAYGLRPNYKLANSYSLIDTSSGTIVSNIPVIAPHHQQYPAQVMLSTDTFSSSDPAKYTQSLVTTNVSVDQRWGEERTNAIWVDVGDLHYSTFHDYIHTPDINHRLDRWGEQLPNTKATAYTWVSSPVLPTEWVDYAQAYDDPEGLVKLSGQPMVNLYYRVRADSDSAYGEWQEIRGERTVHQVFGQMTDDLTSAAIANPFADDLQLSTSIEVFINGEFIANIAIDPTTDQVILPRLPLVSDTVTLRLINNQWRTFIQDRHNYQPYVSEADIVEYIAFTPYTITTRYVGVGEFVQPVDTYHFWISESNSIANTSNSSVRQLETMINDTPAVFAVIDKLVYDPSFTNTTKFKYTSLALSGLDQLITSDQRFAIRLSVNRSLATNDTSMTVHNEWEMFREHQSYLIPDQLWNKLVESMVGYQLSDPDQPVPSIERIFYDQDNNTVSRYGIQQDQALGDSDNIVQTVLAIISDPTTDVYPVDKDQFFDKYSFATTEDIRISMEYIRSYFPVSVINQIVVEVIKDFLTLAPNDSNLMKTSWISISGTTIVDVQQ